MNLQKFEIWQQGLRVILMMFFVTMIAFAIPLPWFFYSGTYIGDLIMMTWAFIWLPVILSYILSALLKAKEVKQLLKKKAYDINPLQRYIALLIGNALAVWHTAHFENLETAGWLFGAYVLLGIPIQLMIIGVFEGFIFCMRKYHNHKTV